MEKLSQHRYRPGCLSRFLVLPLLLDEELRPVTLYTGFIVLMGAALYHWLEDWTWLDSLYFVIITLTTIGYGDFSPTSPLTKAITIFYALNGVAILLILIGEIRRVRRDHVEHLRDLLDDE